jgi:DNA-binding response OmpR family regulator
MPIRVLVVDDEPAIRELLTEYLRGRGLIVNAVADGEAAQVLLEREPPDIVLTDLKLPGVDGIEVVRRAAACDPAVPALMMTGFGTVDTAVSAFTAGARDYLAKPFRLRDLYASLERVLLAAQRDRRHAWASTAMDLLARAETVEAPADAERLVPELAALVRAAPERASLAVFLRAEPDAHPLGASRWVTLSPALPALLPYVRAVDAALRRTAP